MVTKKQIRGNLHIQKELITKLKETRMRNILQTEKHATY